MKGRATIVHRSPVLMAARRSRNDPPSSGNVAPASTSASGVESAGEAIGEGDRAPTPAPTSSSAAKGLGSVRHPHRFAEAEGQGPLSVVLDARGRWRSDPQGIAPPTVSRRRHAEVCRFPAGYRGPMGT